jgi:hypothetical protein
LELDARTYRHTTAPHSLNRKLKKKKKRLRRGWHRIRTPESKRLLGTTTQDSNNSSITTKGNCIQIFLQGLTPTEFTDYSLRRATKKIKQVKKHSPPLRTSRRTLARFKVEKAHAFTEHLAKVFQPHHSEKEPKEEEALIQLPETPYQLEPQINPLKRAEVQEVAKSLNLKKSQIHLIPDEILKELPVIVIKYLIQLFNAVLFKGYFPAQWKVAQIILILKSGKLSYELTSYRPISLLPIVSKVFEKLFLKVAPAQC